MDVKEIRKDIRKRVQDKIEVGMQVNQDWQTTEILNDYSNISGEDSDFYLITARAWVNKEVKDAIGLYEPKVDISPDGEVPQQLTLDGFEHLQKAYPVKRGKTRFLIPIEQMTDEELMAKAAEYRSMAKGLEDHAAEIDAYVDNRGSSVTA